MRLIQRDHPLSDSGYSRCCLLQLTERGWCERLVDIAPDEDAAHLRFVLSPGPTPASRLLVERRLAAMPPEDAAGGGQGTSRAQG